MHDLTLKYAETRLANWLVKRCPDPRASKTVTIQIAAEPGTLSEIFSRTLAKFRELKLIEVAGKTITVLSPQKLAALLRQNLGE